METAPNHNFDATLDFNYFEVKLSKSDRDNALNHYDSMTRASDSWTFNIECIDTGNYNRQYLNIASHSRLSQNGLVKYGCGCISPSNSKSV